MLKLSRMMVISRPSILMTGILFILSGILNGLSVSDADLRRSTTDRFTKKKVMKIKILAIMAMISILPIMAKAAITNNINIKAKIGV